MPEENKYLTFIDHLEELRIRLIYCLFSLIIFTIIGYFFSAPVIGFLLKPFEKAQAQENSKVITIIKDKDGNLKLKDPEILDSKQHISSEQFIIVDKDDPNKKFVFGHNYKTQFYYFSPMTPFILQFKAAFFIAVLLSLPVIIYQMWRFVSPALTQKEKKVSIFVIAGALILFPTGAAFAYYILKYALFFLLSFQISGLEPRIDVMRYLGFAVTMMIAMGAVFEFPIVALFLGKIGIISSAKMKKYRRYAVVMITIFSAVITPSPDPFSMIIVAIPLYFLYEISIYLVKLVEKGADESSPDNALAG